MNEGITPWEEVPTNPSSQDEAQTESTTIRGEKKGPRQPHSSILSQKGGVGEGLSGAERREARAKERNATGRMAVVLKRNNLLPALEDAPSSDKEASRGQSRPGPLAGDGAGVGSAVVIGAKGGSGNVSNRRGSVEEGAVGAADRIFSWTPSMVADMLRNMGLPHLAETALSKEVYGSSLLHVRQPLGADEAIGQLLGTRDGKEQREVIAKIKDIRGEEIATAPKALIHVVSRIDAARQKGGASMVLDGTKMSRIPDMICDMVSLTSLSACSNNLRGLMPEVGLLTKLLSLKLTKNKILTLPESVGYLHNLQLLLLDDNDLRRLPGGICTCSSLRVLDVSQNKLSMLPTGLYACNKINKLNVYDNPLLIPGGVISRGPVAILKMLKAMHLCDRTGICDLSSMQLKGVPPVILTLTNLQTLKLDGNSIMHLDGLQIQTSLTVLSISNNPIKALPLCLKSLTNLTELIAQDCFSLVSPPDAIMSLDGQRIVKYLDAKSSLIADNIESMFNAFDADRSGSISRAELAEGLDLVGLSHRREEINLILETAEGDNNGLISLGEFSDLMLGLLQLGAAEEQRLNLSGIGMPSFVLDFSQPGFINQIDLSHNMLTTLPDSMALLTGLTMLVLDSNMFTEIHQALQLSSIRHLSLKHNVIEEIPSWLPRMHHLKNLLLDYNRLTRVPCEVGGLTNMDNLSLTGNPLRMPLKRLLEEGSSYVRAYLALFMQAQEEGFLDLCSMGLQSLPMEADLSRVRTCLLSDNKLAISPAGLSAATQLVYLDMAQNGMENIEASIFAQIKGVETIVLSGNRLQGLSRKIGLLIALRSLDLAHNKIVELPNSLSCLTSLLTLNLNNNSLEQFPPAVCGLTNLTYLSMEFNSLWGLLDELGQMTALKRLTLKANNIQRLPDCFVKMNLNSMDVSRNPLQGVPAAVGSLLSCLVDIKLDRHLHLEDPPDVLIARGTKALLSYLSRQFKAVTSRCLDLSKLQLASLTVPLDRIERLCKGLQVLDISDNQVHELPRTIGADLGHLQQLVLRNNRLGELPLSTKHLKTLTHLDIAGNLFDRIPEMLIYTPLIKYLNMDRNKFDSLYRKIDTFTGGGFDDAVAANKRETTKDQVRGIRSLKGLIQNNVMDKIHSDRKSQNRTKQVGALFQLLDIETLVLSNNLVRILPGTISKFEHMTSLDMHCNQLQDLPPDIGHCSHLTRLDVSHNDLMGLPPDIGSLHKLQYFNLSDNRVARLPDEIGNMTSLTELNFDNNSLVFIPVEIEGLETSLTLLHASGNIIRDPPAEILSQGRDALFTYLRRVRNGRKSRELVLIEMKLEHVNFNYEALTVLTDLELSGNMITELPKELLMLTNLTKLKAPGNRLSRVIRGGEIGVLSNLTELHLKDNRLRNLDTSLGALKLLKEIDLQSNRLDDMVAEIVECQKVKSLNFSRNLMETLPKHIFRIPDIACLRLDHNILMCLPAAICFAVHIKELDLSYNRLQTLPRDIGNLYEMVYFNLDNNLLSEIPPSIKYCSSLQQLHLNDNKLSTLPPQVRAMKSLKELHIRNNCLIGLPMEIKGLVSLEALSVEGNPFFSLPSSTRELKTLRFLGTNENQLQALSVEGDTPPDSTVVFGTSDTNVRIRKLPRHVAVGGVRRMGSYLDRVTRCENALTIDLTHLDLIYVPLEVLHLTALTALDVKENQITAIPEAIITLTNLTHLNMSGNEIVEIPTNFGFLTNVVILSLARNKISLLPGSMQNMVKIQVCDLHVNHLETLLPMKHHNYKSKEEEFHMLALGHLTEGTEWNARATSGDETGSDDPSSSESDEEGVEHMSRRMIAKYERLGLEIQIGVIGIAGIQDLEFSYNKLARLPDLTALQNIRRINISHNILRNLPEEICELQTLEKIELGDNRIRAVPAEVSKLTRLTLLSLKNNNLRILPPEIGKCLNLKYLSVYANDLIELPEEVSNLKKLLRLSAQANKISCLPWLLGNLASLKVLNMTSNPLKALPPSLGSLENVLETLELNECEDLMDPPDMVVKQGHATIMSYLRKVWRGFNTRRMVCVGLKMGRFRVNLNHPDLRELVELRLDKNLLLVLPAEVGRLPCLISLRLRENLFEKLPESLSGLTTLQELDISKNRLTLIPRSILVLTNLIRLRCGNNPIPYSIPSNWIEEKVQKFLINHVRETIGKRICAMWGSSSLGEFFNAWYEVVKGVNHADYEDDVRY